MRKKLLPFVEILMMVSAFIFPMSAEEKVTTTTTDKVSKEKEEPPKEQTVSTKHTININGAVIPYTATIGNFIIKQGEKEEDKGSFFYTSYIKDDTQDQTNRPVTFCFNGGPGSSSVWLHMGAFGPKLVHFEDLTFQRAPITLDDNPYCLLDLTDMVFIDPVSTGYSRAIPTNDAKDFHGVDQDIKSVAEFIRIWTTHNNRWASPKFLAGESYGTTRAAGLSLYLHDEKYLYLNGLVLISTILDFQAYNFDHANDLAYQMFLPTFTTTAWYHKKLPGDLQTSLPKAAKAAQDFVINEYSVALLKGASLTPQERNTIIDKLSSLTGLSKDYIDHSNLRVDQSHYCKELLKKERRVVGRFDSRYVGIDPDGIKSTCTNDPSMEVTMGIFTGALNHYIRTDLQWVDDKEYKIIADVWPWDFGDAKNEYLHLGSNLKDNMSKNPRLKVFVGSGLYDLATPYFAVEYSFNHLGIDPVLMPNISKYYYEAGHMMYLHRPSLEKLKSDLSEFYKIAS